MANISDNDIVVSSWEDLCEKLYLNSWKEGLQRFRTDYAFRGVSDKSYELKNRFLRNCGDDENLEFHLLRNFKKYAKLNRQSLASDWDLVTIGQHYGLPTRLMDWTYSPFVAVHFATSNLEKFDKDGAIWMVDFVKAKSVLPETLRKALKASGSNTFTIDLLDETIPHLTDFDSLSISNFALFFEPPSIDERIVNQYAFFSVMSSPTALMDDWLILNNEFYYRIIIPRELKWEVRDKLDQANITERLLFPGLDGLAKWLERHYYPRK